MATPPARVLVTRHAPEAEETASRLRDLGFEPVISPVRRLIPLNPPPVTGVFDGLIVTSRNALHAGVRLPEQLLAQPVLCVGDRTADAARNAGFRNIVVGDGDAPALVDAIAARMPAGARLLYLAGEPRREAIEADLARLGYRLETCLTYRMARANGLTGDAIDALRSGTLAAILHFSAESARDCLDLAESAGLAAEAAHTRHFCLSQRVAEAVRMREIAPARIHIAESPDQASLLALLRTHLTT